MSHVSLAIFSEAWDQSSDAGLSAFLARRAQLFPHLSLDLSSPLSSSCLFIQSSIHTKLIRRRIDTWDLILESSTDFLDEPCLAHLLSQVQAPKLGSPELRKLWNQTFSLKRHSFFLLALNRDSGLVLFACDALTRLPVYLYCEAGRMVLGRDIGFCKLMSASWTPDKLYLALNTIFGYVPGRGTFYPALDTLKPGSIGLFVAPEGKLILSEDSLLRFPKPDTSGGIKPRCKELVQLFEEATSLLTKDQKPILALSGGLDSRALGAALNNGKIKYEAVTYQDAENTAALDVRISLLLAKALKANHQLLTLSQETPLSFSRMFELKQGINYLGVSFLLDFMVQLLEFYPQSTMLLTGDGGDKLMPCLLPEAQIKNDSAYLDYLYAHNAQFPVYMICGLFALKRSDVDAYLLDLAATYPADSYAQRYKYFLLAERGGRWLFEGEDRNRIYLPSETPFYDYDFYRAALSVPDSWKKNLKLYRLFLEYLSPAIANVPNANNMLRPDQIGYSLIQTAISLLRKSSAIRKWRTRTHNQNIRFTSQNWIISSSLNLLENQSISTYLNTGHPLWKEENLRKLSRLQLNLLFTTLSILSSGQDSNPHSDQLWS
ncbi:MAG: asparagine synthase-related protein [Candidatus Cloacimonetes bacterium]|nr:asparagine synthase-related protein [Candidatus Cloacimonadota bacterium]